MTCDHDADAPQDKEGDTGAYMQTGVCTCRQVHTCRNRYRAQARRRQAAPTRASVPPRARPHEQREVVGGGRADCVRGFCRLASTHRPQSTPYVHDMYMYMYMYMCSSSYADASSGMALTAAVGYTSTPPFCELGLPHRCRGVVERPRALFTRPSTSGVSCMFMPQHAMPVRMVGRMRAWKVLVSDPRRCVRRLSVLQPYEADSHGRQARRAWGAVFSLFILEPRPSTAVLISIV